MISYSVFSRFIVQCTALIFLLAQSPSVSFASLLTNGGFEDGLNGWTFTGDGIDDTVSLSTDTPSGSGFSADIDINAGNGLPWLQQDISVSEGDELTLSVSAREIVPSTPDAWIAAQLWMLPSDLSSILTSSSLFFTNANWETQTTTLTVPTGAAVARVLFTPQNPSFGVGTGQYLIDDVNLTAIPEPASVSLAMLTLAALYPSRLRRRPAYCDQCV